MVNKTGLRTICLVAFWLTLSSFASSLMAQEKSTPAETDAPAAESSPATDTPSEPALSEQQQSISLQFRRFEKTIRDLAEYMKGSDPERADLLIRAFGQAKKDQLSLQMEAISRLLEEKQLGDAIDQQSELVSQLRVLLELLQSEDRLSELEREQQRIKGLIKDLGKVLSREKDIRAATERGGDPQRLADSQQHNADETRRLGQKIDEQDAERRKGAGKPSEGKPSEGKPSEGKPSEGKPSEGKPSEGKPSEGKPSEGKPSEGKPSEGKPSEGKPSEGKPSEGKPSESESSPQSPGDSPQQTPGREEIEEAHREMERAIEELKGKQQKKASEHQDKAIQELTAAKEKLEEILRQLREEEKDLLLAALEARFQKMLAMELVVHSGTVAIDKIPEAERTSRHSSRAIKLARDQDQIGLEADKALTLLREEGSSVALPEAVEQLREDMRLVSRRLDQAAVGEVTQAIEQDIIEVLEEIIAALQQEMEKGEDKPSPPMQAQPTDPGLVDKIAELKMLRSLQFRINRRTRLLGRQIDGEQANDPDVVEQLRDLSGRQSRVHQITHDIAIGKNQ